MMDFENNFQKDPCPYEVENEGETVPEDIIQEFEGLAVSQNDKPGPNSGIPQSCPSPMNTSPTSISPEKVPVFLNQNVFFKSTTSSTLRGQSLRQMVNRNRQRSLLLALLSLKKGPNSSTSRPEKTISKRGEGQMSPSSSWRKILKKQWSPTGQVENGTFTISRLKPYTLQSYPHFANNIPNRKLKQNQHSYSIFPVGPAPSTFSWSDYPDIRNTLLSRMKDIEFRKSRRDPDVQRLGQLTIKPAQSRPSFWEGNSAKFDTSGKSRLKNIVREIIPLKAEEVVHYNKEVQSKQVSSTTIELESEEHFEDSQYSEYEIFECEHCHHCSAIGHNLEKI